MSQEERDWLEWLKRVEDGMITQREAAEKMGVSARWVRTLLERKQKRGDAVVVHGLRGKPSNRKLPAETRRQALAILKQSEWHDFGPTFAAERKGSGALPGEMKARYQGRYVAIGECGVQAIAVEPEYANRFGRITMREVGAIGCKASSIAPVHRCGSLWEIKSPNPILETPGKGGPAIFAF